MNHAMPAQPTMARPRLSRHVTECVAGALALAVAFAFPPARQPEPATPAPAAHWAPVTRGLSTAHGADLSGYDATCVARIELVDAREVVTMVACPDGRVAWFG